MRLPTAHRSEQLGVELIETLAQAFTGEFGLLHSACERAEVRRGVASGSITPRSSNSTRAVLNVTPIMLGKFLPDLYSTTLFGPTYVEFFGRSTLLNTPGVDVEELEYGGVLMRLRPLEAASEDDLQASSREKDRERVKTFLGRDAFFEVVKGREYPYEVPPGMARPEVASAGIN
ncbi:MAG: hypothetical protein U0X73_04020 [Thermoanaerobaculia bacterium]